MAPKSSRKRPAAAISQTSQSDEETSTGQNNFISVEPSTNTGTGAPAEIVLPEAELVYQLQGHGLVMKDGRLGPVCIRGASVVVDNLCRSTSAIVTGGDDGSIRLWDAATGEFRRSLTCTNDSGDVRLLSMSKFPSGDRILTTHSDGTAYVLEVGSGKQLAKFGEPGSAAVVHGVMYADQERLVTINASGEFRFWSLASGRENPLIAGGSNTATAIALFPGDRNIAVGTTSGKVDIWCCQSGSCTKEIHAASSPITVLAIFPDGSKVLTASENENFVSIWGVEDIQLNDFGSRVLCAAVSSCGTLVATGEAAGLVKVWEARSGTMLCRWSASSAIQKAVCTCTFLSERQLLATGEWGGAVWELPQACSAAVQAAVTACDATDASVVSQEVKERGSSGVRVSFGLSPPSS